MSEVVCHHFIVMLAWPSATSSFYIDSPCSVIQANMDFHASMARTVHQKFSSEMEGRVAMLNILKMENISSKIWNSVQLCIILVNLVECIV